MECCVCAHLLEDIVGCWIEEVREVAVGEVKSLVREPKLKGSCRQKN